MKKRMRRNQPSAIKRTLAAAQDERDGSVIVVVLALLIGLLLLGVLLFTDASQEEISAEYYAGAGKVAVTELDPEELFFNALRQIILGANHNEKHSPFYGGRMSLLPTMFGADRTAYNGEGVRVVYNTTNGYFVDNDYDGQPDPNTTNSLYLNHSVAAAGTDLSAPGAPNSEFARMASPDVPYVYPDGTSPFLYYQAQVPRYNAAGTAIIGVQRCIIPSYLRPQRLRRMTGDPTGQDWYTNQATARLSARPHAKHFAILRNGTIAMAGGQPVRRFASALHPEAGLANFPFPAVRHGLWTNHGNNYIFDEDLDGDGTKESIFLDMDLGTYTTPDGTGKFVPIVSAKLVSLDSLINLNPSGNLARGQQSNGTVLPSSILTANFMHKSNQGVSRSEINPQWGLLATPPGAAGPLTEQHRIYWAANPTTRVHLANMEYWWLMTGRPQYQGNKSNILNLYPGKYGEESRMRTASANPGSPSIPFPRPGTTLADDNGNRFQGGSYSSFGTGVFPNYMTTWPRFAHPLDYRGAGRFYTSNTRRLLRNVQRHVFAAYSNYFYYQLVWPTLPPTIPAAFPGNTGGSLLVDDESEFRPGVQIAGDSKFSAAETVSLHMSKADRGAVGRDGDRILQLAPYNFLNSPLAGTIRRLYTTESWDVPSIGNVFYGSPVAGLDRKRRWEFTSGHFPPVLAVNNPAPFRTELYALLKQVQNSKTDRSLLRRLSVNGVLGSWPNIPSVPPSLRNQLRFRPLTPHATSLTSAPVSGPNSVLGNIATRKAIAYPELIDPGNASGNTLISRQRQEWLARYDRQRMCRDIYTLLYMFGGGGDINYRSTTNATNQVYSAKQMQTMAQFAVNLVDSLDRDNVITKFEYDIDLSNGWNLDDDPYTDRFDNPAETNQRGVVYGVEGQMLAFSEALAILTKRTKDPTMTANMDHAATDYDDSKNHIFSYLELQNTTPGAFDFDSKWQIVVKDSRTATQLAAMPAGPFVAERRLTLLNHPANRITAPTSGFDTASRFTIATQDDKDYLSGTNIKPSYFLANPRYDDVAGSGFVRCAPRNAPNLDLMIAGSAPRYRINNKPTSGHTVAGTFIEEGPGIPGAPPADPAGKNLLQLVTGNFGDPAMQTPATPGQLDDPTLISMSVRVQIRRRLHLNRTVPVNVDSNGPNHRIQSRDNPWIVVDEMLVPMRFFTLATTNTKTVDLRNELLKLVSRERRQPLSASLRNYPITGINTTNAPPAGAAGDDVYRLNSLGTLNRATSTLPGNRFTLWHPHLDRDFASAAELLGLPLYGPDRVTRDLGTTTAPYKTNINNTAVNRFLRPDLPLTVPAPPPPIPPTVNGENRWYRLLELMEVPDRNPNSNPWYVDRVGGFNNVALSRIAGKMAVNTMSHPSQLAALLDDPDLLTINPGNTAPFLRDNTAEQRDWWGQFLLSRDGYDVLSGGYVLPGVPGTSRPFRPLNYVVNNYTSAMTPYTNSSIRSMEQTVLRSLPQDGGGVGQITNRRLFELGTQSQHNNALSNTNIDVTTRYRLLNKVMNHTTTRSNVFVLILKIDFFEAKEITPSNPSFTGEKVVRIGAKLPTSPGYLSYYVIDRSKAATLVQRRDLPEANQEGVAGRFSWRFRQDMDFSSLILHKQRIK